jgi:hypothetical protein
LTINTSNLSNNDYYQVNIQFSLNIFFI